MRTVTAEMTASLRGYWTDARPAQRAAYVVGAVLVVVGLAHGAAWLVLGGSADGPLSWRKPLTFGVSFGLATATLAWVSQFLDLSDRAQRRTLVPLAVANSIEVAWVSVQHARGVASHFNTDTALDNLLFISNGVAILVTVAVIAGYTVRAFTTPAGAPSMTLALRVGLLILLVSMAVGVWMILRGTAFDAADPVLIPESGSLKVAHAVGMHGIQTLAALAWLVSFTALAEPVRVRLVALGAVGYSLATVATVVLTALGLGPFAAGAASVLLAIVSLGCLTVAFGVTVVALVRRPVTERRALGPPGGQGR